MVKWLPSEEICTTTRFQNLNKTVFISHSSIILGIIMDPVIIYLFVIAQSAGAVEYTDCTFVEG